MNDRARGAVIALGIAGAGGFAAACALPLSLEARVVLGAAALALYAAALVASGLALP